MPATDITLEPKQGQDGAPDEAAPILPKPVQEHLGQKLRAQYYETSDRPAYVGDPAIPRSCSVSILDLGTRRRVADIEVPGRTRWAVYDSRADAFHVNIADPPQILVVESGDPARIRRAVPLPYAGPHGLDIDVSNRRLFCACDAAVLAEVDADSGRVLGTEALAGVPDVVFFNAAMNRLYVATGAPGVIEVFGTTPLRHHETITTERGAHTLSFDGLRNMVCAFLPESHRAAVYEET
jgi:hypothetical protein